MTQPSYVPIATADKVRTSERMPVPGAWRQDRPGEITGGQPAGAGMGKPGPDQGYGLKVARLLAPRLRLQPGERAEDAVAGCLGVGLARAALYGRAPVVYDMELAYTLWGFMLGAPPDLVEYRLPLFRAVAHDYTRQREIADRVPEETLRLTSDSVAGHLSDWRTLIRL